MTFKMRFVFVFAFLGHFAMATNVVEVDVLILGAGITGITAGNHFQSNNLTNFLILEAQNHIGGRIKQSHFGNVTVEEGAFWVHFVEEGDDNPILSLAKEANLQRYVNVETDIAIKNTNHSKEDFERTLKTFKEINAKIVQHNEENPRNRDQPLKSVLALNGWIADTPLKRTVEWNVDFEYAVKPAMISARHFTGLPEENDIVTDIRGYKGIIDHLSQNFTSKIKTQKIVAQIKYNTSGIEVLTKDGEIYKAKYGLCTFSTGVLASKSVEFLPELPEWKMEAITRIPLAYYTNIFVKFPVAFWEDNEFIVNTGSISETFPILYNLNKKGIHEGSNILLFTAVDDNSMRIEAQDLNETRDEVMKTLRKMYPNVTIPQPEAIHVGQFSQNPFVRGAFSNAVIGSTSADFHNLQGRLDNLFFAGEATDEEYWGYAQGGYFSGLKQAKAIVKCLNGQECPVYQPEDADVIQVPFGNAGNLGKPFFISLVSLLVHVLLN